MRKKIILICSKCLARNYTTSKKQTSSERLEIKKYCPHCNEYTIHKESK